jgi:hypothetical protein
MVACGGILCHLDYLADMLLEKTDHDNDLLAKQEDFLYVVMQRASVIVTAGICKPSMARFGRDGHYLLHCFSRVS